MLEEDFGFVFIYLLHQPPYEFVRSKKLANLLCFAGGIKMKRIIVEKFCYDFTWFSLFYFK